MRVVAIIAAGGRGERLGAGLPKQLLEVGGRTILERSIDAFASCDLVDETIVVLPPSLAAASPPGVDVTRQAVRVVAGGARRQDSVAAGFDAVPPGVDVVLVHDAARPFVSREVIERTIAAAAEHGAAIAAVPSRDTVKQAQFDEGRPVVSATLPREEIYLAQTPQGFRWAVLADAVALGRRGVDATDEAMLAELAGHPVCLVEGDVRNMKVTTPGDLPIAEALAARAGASAAPGWRVGTGYDLHRFVEGRPLVLGGVRVPHDRGLAGHSDADAVSHAVTDAILGAAGLGDIGRLFPDTDPAWKDADSLGLLADAVRRVHAAGFEIVNVDIVVIAEQPKIGPHADAIRASLAGVLGVPSSAVSVKGKTNEGVDTIGRGGALAVHAVALLARR
ncbi:MAG: ispDF [Acidobacteria bacterium]|nr:ispDF [Acidobacteriota bacterium]